jgi:hypothetical protein
MAFACHHSQSEDYSLGKPMVNPYSTQAKASNHVDFLLKFRSWGGPDLCDGIHERETELVLNGAQLLASMEKHRSESDAEGEAIGWFQMNLDAAAIKKVRGFLDTVRLYDLVVMPSGSLGSSILEIEIQDAARKYTCSISSNDIMSIQKINPLLNELFSIQDALNLNPIAAITVSVKRQEFEGRLHFALIVKNIGTREASFLDPRFLDYTEETWAGVRLAYFPKETEGVTSPPLEWSRLRVSRHLPANTPIKKVITLHALEEVTFLTDLWDSTIYPGGMRYLVQGVYCDYSRYGDRKSILKGATFSKAIEVIP